MSWFRHCDSGLSIRGDGRSLADPGNTFECSLCGDVVMEEKVPEYFIDLQCCEACANARVKNLVAEEQAIQRLSDLLRPRNGEIDLAQICMELAGLSLAAEFGRNGR